MAVVYMRKLEQEPETYDKNFTTLTKGVNIKAQDWILNQIGTTKYILEYGCGTGALASKMALKGNNVVAIDKNYLMITHAMESFPPDASENLIYQIGSFSDFPMNPRSKDLVVSTFMLSELRPLEQQMFLRKAWKALKPDGRLIIAAEFVPSGLWKISFKIKRWRYKKKLRRLRLKQTHLLNWFFKYIEPIGFKITAQKNWKHGSIQALELQKIKDDGSNEPGYYRPGLKKFVGIGSQLRIYRCIFTGQVDRVPIEPGIYQSGNPDKNSPIIVTANYDFTYIKVMRDLKGVDAWVLCLDSNGINVWCAARGPDFGNPQLIEAVKATNIQSFTEKRTLILPQLSAGGISVPNLPKGTEEFPFKVVFGPVWSSHLQEYVKNRPARKPDSMKLAKFTPFHRIRAFTTHTTFLFRKLFLIPFLGLIVAFLSLSIIPGLDFINRILWVGELSLWIISTNLLITLLFPLSNFTRKFISKAIFFGVLNTTFLIGLNWFLHGSLMYLVWNSCFYFWIAFFSTMSLSGYSMSTSPREIQTEYPIFTKINSTLLMISAVLLAIGMTFYII